MAFGAGETLRAALGRPHFAFVMRQHWKLFTLWIGMHLWWACLIATPFLFRGATQIISVLAALILFPTALMILRCRSVSLGLYSVVAWNAYALCFIPGLLRRRTDPARWIESREVDDAVEVSNAPVRVGLAAATEAR
jgi:hypothetical protein